MKGWENTSIFLLCICTLIKADMSENENVKSRIKRLVPVFQVVRFPNTVCSTSAGPKNGTCYTTEECAAKGGVAGGSCASGFGVCCTFTLGCGGTGKENVTYFDQLTTIASGPCTAKICKVSPDICQIRLDFDTFVITGPSTFSASYVAETLNGVAIAKQSAANAVSLASKCMTDSFTVTNQQNLPTLCGTLSNEHVYFDASDACNFLAFQFGPSGNGATVPTRSFSIKVSQYSCSYPNLAPDGCDQYFFGEPGSGYIQTFNHQGSKHLAGQSQDICFRREINMCRLCLSADAVIDIKLSGSAAGTPPPTTCCNYGSDGKKLSYDCLIIPGAVSTKGAAAPVSQCGGSKGLYTAAASGKTICTTSVPFRISFLSDQFEFKAEIGDLGFRLKYFQGSC